MFSCIGADLVLLCQKFRCLFRVAIGAAQHGHRDNVGTRATTSRFRFERYAGTVPRHDPHHAQAACSKFLVMNPNCADGSNPLTEHTLL